MEKILLEKLEGEAEIYSVSQRLFTLGGSEVQYALQNINPSFPSADAICFLHIWVKSALCLCVYQQIDQRFSDLFWGKLSSC